MLKFSQLEYKPINLEAFEKSVEGLLKQFTSCQLADEQIKVFQEINALRNEVLSMIDLCYARYSLNTKDEYYSQQMDYVDEIEPEIQGVNTKIYKAVLASPFVNELEKNIGSVYIQKAQNALKTYSDEIKEDLVVENKLSSEYMKVLAQAEIDYKGQIRNLAQMQAFMVSKDREERRRASEKYYEFMAAHQETLDRIYDEQVKVRHKIATKLGYKNFIELGYLRMNRLDYNAEMVQVYRKQVRDFVVPLGVELRKKQQKRLGIEQLAYYDVNYQFTSGNPKPQGDSDWIVNQGRLMYSELPKETHEFYQMMIDRELVDLVAKPGKSGGGYCMYLPHYKVPFVFANFNGTEHDIVVMTHEMGHAFQSYMSRWLEVAEVNDPTSESAEIHSMSMEFLTYPWMENFFGPDTDKFKFVHMSDGILFIPYGVLVDHFQHMVYENPKASPKERRAMWRDLEKIYLPYLDYSENDYLEQGGFWHKQGHIFEDPFYYIDYTLAQVCAYQFYIRDLKDHESAWKDYLKLCSAGGSKSFLELVELAGLKSPFEEGTLEEVVRIISEKLGAIDDANF